MANETQQTNYLRAMTTINEVLHPAGEVEVAYLQAEATAAVAAALLALTEAVQQVGIALEKQSNG